MIVPFYPSGRRGRPTRRIEIMLQQNWFNLADEALEDAVYDSYSFCSFLYLDFFDEQVPDATTLLKFRSLLEKNKIGEKIFADVKECFEKAGLMMHGGIIVDATIISAPCSIKCTRNVQDGSWFTWIAMIEPFYPFVAVLPDGLKACSMCKCSSLGLIWLMRDRKIMSVTAIPSAHRPRFL